jgi:hypothetical protein
MPWISRPKPRKQADANILTLLSLNLLLLGFFILLTALSNFQEDRQRLVLESVNEAFNGRVAADRSYSESSSGLDNLEEIEALLDDAGKLFGSALPAVKVKRAADRPVVRFELSAATLFAPESVDLRPGRWLLLRRLVEALTEEGRRDLPYELSIIHAVATDAPPRSLAETSRSLVVQRLDSLATALIARGLPAERLSVGVEPRPERVRTVSFVLRIGQPGLGPRRAERSPA